MPNMSLQQNVNENSTASPVEQPQQPQVTPFQFVPRSDNTTQSPAEPTPRPSLRTPPLYVAQLSNETSSAQPTNVQPVEKRVHFDATADIPTAQNQKKRVKRSRSKKQKTAPPNNTQIANQTASQPVSVESVFPAPTQRDVQPPVQAVPKPAAQTVVQAPTQAVIQPVVQPLQQAVPTKSASTVHQTENTHQRASPHQYSYYHVSSSTFNNGKTETKEKYEIRQPELVLKAERNPQTHGLYNVVVEKTSGNNQKEIVYQQLPANQFKSQINQTWSNALTGSQPKALPQSESPSKVIPQIANGAQTHVCPVHQPAQTNNIKVVKKIAAPSKVSVPVIFINSDGSHSHPFKQVRHQQLRPLVFRAF